MSKIYKISILGSGRMASEHAKVMKNMNNIEISNVYSRNMNNAKRFANKFNIKKFTNNLNEIFENKIDGVLICVSADKIYLVTCKVLKYQIPLLIEKPIGLSLKEVQNLKKLNSKYKTINLIGLNRRYYSNFQNINNLLNSKDYRGFAIEGHEHLSKIKKIVKKSLLKNWLYANSIHTVNLIDFFTLGNKYKIKYFSYNNKYEKNICCIVKSENNILGTYSSNWKSNEKWSVKLFFDGYHISFKPLEEISIYYKNRKKYKILLSKYDKIFKPGLYNQMKNFIKLIESKKNTWPDENINSIISTYKILNKIN